MSGLYFAAATWALAVAIHVGGKSLREGRPIDAAISAATLVLASLLYLAGFFRILGNG